MFIPCWIFYPVQQSSGNVPAFLAKLWKMVDNPETGIYLSSIYLLSIYLLSNKIYLSFFCLSSIHLTYIPIYLCYIRIYLFIFYPSVYLSFFYLSSIYLTYISIYLSLFISCWRTGRRTIYLSVNCDRFCHSKMTLTGYPPDLAFLWMFIYCSVMLALYTHLKNASYVIRIDPPRLLYLCL